MQTYRQDVKNEAREKLVKHAVQSLTDERDKSFLVSQEHFIKITDHFNEMFFQFLGNKNFEYINQYNWLFSSEKNNWLEFYKEKCKPKLASELKVLYLSGPEPYNDIEILCNNGIILENIWAIESDKKIYNEALKSLIENRIHIKLHRGSLAEFFELTNHEFDIVYFDACTPILSTQQSPLEIIKQLFVNKRLTGLSTFITNFAEPSDNYNWGDILATWFATKEFYEVPSVDDEFGMSPLEKSSSFHLYSSFINQHLDSYYDIFLTHFIPTIASEIIPMWQLSSLGSVQSNHLLNEQLLQKELKIIKSDKINTDNSDEILKEIPHYILSIDNYPLLNWVRLINNNLPKDHTLRQFINSTRKKMTMEDALYIGSLLKRFEEVDSGFKTFIHNICGESLKEIITKLDFFDRNMNLTCDIPMKNLLIELLLGIYGHPYIAHTGKTMGLKYKAKSTWMYSNVFVFDQCRYLYDFLPTLDLWESFFENISHQTIIRGCIDEIRRNHLHLNNSLFKWGFIEGIYGEFTHSTLSERINLNIENIDV